MPIKGARYRVKTLSSGKRIRLAFRGNKAVEVTDFDTGKMLKSPVKSKKKKPAKRSRY